MILPSSSGAEVHPMTPSTAATRRSSRRPLPQRRKKTVQVEDDDEIIPLLRGKIHLALLYSAPIWTYHLWQRCSSTKAMWSALIAIVCALVNFGCSALLHNVHWSSDYTRTLWRRLDHAGIFLMIAGSCAPCPLLLFSTKMSLIWAVFQWGATLGGICVCLASNSFSISDQYGTRATVYAVVGLSNACFALEFGRVLSFTENVLLVSMAASYVLGACFYGCKWPDIWPGVLGYHEVFHLMCLLAACFTFALDYQVLGRAAF